MNWNRKPDAAAPSSPWLDRSAWVWTALVTLIPTVFGVLMYAHPQGVVSPGATALDVFHAMSLRNFAFSLVLGVALLTQPARTVAVLLAARGLTELADGASGVFVTSAGSSLAPYVGGVGDLLVALFLDRRGR